MLPISKILLILHSREKMEKYLGNSRIIGITHRDTDTYVIFSHLPGQTTVGYEITLFLIGHRVFSFFLSSFLSEFRGYSTGRVIGRRCRVTFRRNRRYVSSMYTLPLKTIRYIIYIFCIRDKDSLRSNKE